MHITFAENLKRLRTAKGLSQRELAEKIYVTRAAVARWESGSRLPDAMIISRLSKCLDTDSDALISSVLASGMRRGFSADCADIMGFSHHAEHKSMK